MKSKSLKLILSAGLFLFPAISQASVDSLLKLELKCYFQERITQSDTKETGRVKIARFDSKQLLKIISKEAGVRFPGGSQLKVASDGKVYVADNKGRLVRNVSNYLKAEIDDQNSLFDGQYNRETGKEHSRNYFPIAFTINLPELKGTVEGIAIEDFKAYAADNLGVQRLTGKTASAVNGKGSIEGKLAYYEGMLRLDGKQAVIEE